MSYTLSSEGYRRQHGFLPPQSPAYPGRWYGYNRDARWFRWNRGLRPKGMAYIRDLSQPPRRVPVDLHWEDRLSRILLVASAGMMVPIIYEGMQYWARVLPRRPGDGGPHPALLPYDHVAPAA